MKSFDDEYNYKNGYNASNCKNINEHLWLFKNSPIKVNLLFIKFYFYANVFTKQKPVLYLSDLLIENDKKNDNSSNKYYELILIH